jgi:multidrug efflux pump subunit AcrA (membrane-fusion protein)
MSTRRTIIIVAAVAAVALAAGGIAWKSGRGVSTQAASAAAQNAKSAGQVIELIPVELHTISPRGLVDTVRFTGTTQPVDQTIVKARVPGRLAEVLVREGDKVTKGQVLARFEEAELQSKVNERRSALDAARADAR